MFFTLWCILYIHDTRLLKFEVHVLCNFGSYSKPSLHMYIIYMYYKVDL